MKLSISIMAHKSREQFIPYLLKELKGAKVFIDDGKLGVCGNAFRCWSSYNPNADYHLLIQDDAILTKDFLNKAKKLLKSKKEIISFYKGRRVKSSECIIIKNFYVSDWLTGGVALAIRTDQIKDMLKSFQKQKIPNDDTRIARFFRNRNIKIYYSNPSLVNHRTGIKSIVENKIVGQGRTSDNFK